MKKQLIIGFFLLLYANIQAQETNQYLYFNAGGGSHNLSYKLPYGIEKGGCGYSFNAGYGFYIDKHWGFQTGIGFQTFNPTATLNYMTSVPAIDSDGANYVFRTSYNNWKEKQQLLMFEIPIGAQYRFDIKEKIQFVATAGLKVLFPVKTTYKSTGGELVTSGLYSQWNVELKDLPQHGFNTITDQVKGNVTVKASCVAYAEAGALYGLTPRLDLYAGGYIDLGMNNVLKSDNRLVYQMDGVYNGVLASNQTEKAKTVALGMKVGVRWHFGQKKAIKEVVTQPIPVAEKPVVVEKPVIVEKVPEVKETPKEVVIEQPVAKVIKAPETTPEEDSYSLARALAESIRITFKFNSSIPLNSEDSKIKALCSILKATHGMTLRIVGHTDRLGTRKVNNKIGLQRAENVKQKFLKCGVPASKLKREAKLYSKSDYENGLQKRVVELIVE